MSGVAEKARFYLERSVPQLREWQQKEIFTEEEIRTIVQKRNDFEHKVLSPGNKASDWSAYAKWEQSLEALRSKRCVRLKLRRLNSAHNGQARVMAIYERAVNRHSASHELWREYLEYTAKVKATKRWRRIMTNALRMNPTQPDLWIMAGRRSAHNGDMAAARAYFMRGCRFCTRDCMLWIDYARCEMEWLRKVERRKKAKPANDALRPDKTEEGDQLLLGDSDDEDDEEGGLPEPSAAQAKIIDKQSAQKLESNPAMDGAIPMAIFDISQRQAFFQPEVAEMFFIMFASFRDVAVQGRISQHVMEVLNEKYPNHPSTCNCHIQEPILGVSPFTAEFPRNLRDVLPRLKEGLSNTTDRSALVRKTTDWIDGYLALEGLDPSIKTVLEHTKKSLASS
ncbi:U3 small nucleolar RNA-associated protein 6-domain-containing protein [Stachybotrys elegans]|uniref:U3 small nucleolar RNA-associated protein 6-domain-containing protein n=1 Tax=Stachybotrys elegans TaxID=80388 RepID=A0A8K0SRU1_9HYPO|nr:U3 small nucleolar RNA-associated protein 6-domain-containing protein [Stachybotrys elegans]